jgi:hypothetical protein
MKIRRRGHPLNPAPRTSPRDPCNPRNQTGERMSRDGSKGPLYSHPNYRFDEPKVSASWVETQKRTVNGTTMSREAFAKIKKETQR